MACDDTISNVGIGTQPDRDKISVYDTIISIESARTVKLDSIYVKTVKGFVGNFYDPDYGDIKAGFICQYYPSLAFADSGVIKNGAGKEIDSVRLHLYYTSFFGDSLAPMEVSVYPVIKKPVDENYYTNINPADYCDLSKAWARKSYTARDLNVSDSMNSLSTYYKNISIQLPIEWGQQLYDSYKADKNIFESGDNLAEIFKGTYIESSFGTGNLIKVDLAEINIYYRRHYTNSAGNDTTVTTSSVLTLTNEVIQMNSFKSEFDSKLLEYSDDKMYLKTPVGLFSEITIPVPEIVKSVGKRKFSSVKLNISAYAQPETKYPLPLPGLGTLSNNTRSALLLIERDSVVTFFENQKKADSQTTFTAQYTSSSMSYNFDNISNLIQLRADSFPNRNLNLLLIPVMIDYSLVSSGYSSYYQDNFTTHYLAPSAVTLKKGEDNLRLQIIASDMENKQ
jgi:hypothetical protein